MGFSNVEYVRSTLRGGYIMQLMSVPVPSLDRTIFHEVGHLFIGRYFGIKYDGSVAVRIIFSEEHVTYLKSDYEENDSIEIVLYKIILSMAGKELEKKRIGDVLEEGTIEDDKKIRHLEDILQKYWRKNIDEKKLEEICGSILIDNNNVIDELYCYIKKEILTGKFDIGIDDVEKILNKFNISRNNISFPDNIFI
jgi:hypothetical protein